MSAPRTQAQRPTIASLHPQLGNQQTIRLLEAGRGILQTKRADSSVPARGSDDGALTSYLDFLERHQEISKSIVADNYARQITQRWKSGDSLYVLTRTHKKYMIREMLDGVLSEEDEESILDLLEFSEAADYKKLVESLTKKEEARFSPTSLQRLEKIRAKRDQEEVKSGGTFSSEYVRRAMLELVKNAGFWSSLLGQDDCVNTVRNIVLPELYAGKPKVLEAIKAQVAIFCNANRNRMQDVMTGVKAAGYASKPKPIRFLTQLKYFDVGEEKKFPLRAPDRLETSVWETVIQWTKNKEGWHVFGMSLMDGHHSVTLFLHQRPGGPFLYWADQINTFFMKTESYEKGSQSGFRRYSKENLDRYIEQYTKEKWESERVSHPEMPGKFDHGKNILLWKLSPAE